MLLPRQSSVRLQLSVLLFVAVFLVGVTHRDRIPRRLDDERWHGLQGLLSPHRGHKPAVHNVADEANHSDALAHHWTGENEIVDSVDHESDYTPEDVDHQRILYSQSTKDGKYFSVDLAGASTYNVNILPHPTAPGKFLVVAQSLVYRDDIGASEELYCVASFVEGVLHCQERAESLPLAHSILGECDDPWGYTNLRHGPRDGRAFYGPDAPYIIYGQQSTYTCLGLWVQDLRLLIDGIKHPSDGIFRGATEIRRPEPWRQIEKNYFLFWDADHNVYAHYDIYPKRAFSHIRHNGEPDGVPFGGWVDLAPETEEHDQRCMAKLMHKLPEAADSEGIHQATNSLSITLCKRSDPTCVPTDDNTFIMHIFQWKTFYDGHGRYEPFVSLFRRSAPFALHGMTTKRFWIHGRDRLTDKTHSVLYSTDGRTEADIPEGHTEMFYVTSMSWAGHNQTYHGYLDDVVFLGFGIEDSRSAAIDVLAGDLVQDLGLC